MGRAEVELTFADQETLEREFEQNLKNGGAFSAESTGHAENDEVDAVLVHPSSGSTLRMPSRVVWSGGDAHPGLGLAFLGFDEIVRDRLQRFVEGEGSPFSLAPPPADEPSAVAEHSTSEVDDRAEARSAEVDDSDPDESNQSLHERLRGLNTVQQRKIAAEGTPNERIALERMYGKNVWPVLLANQRITVPEVARIARMGALPRPLLDQITSNRTWLASSVVRRALLGNPRLGGDQLDKVLKATPRSELKLMFKQASVNRQVKERIRKLLKI